jgi:hypothetical protein
MNMGIVYARIDDDIDKKFRIEVARLYGGERGALSRAIKEAMELWLKQNAEKET